MKTKLNEILSAVLEQYHVSENMVKSDLKRADIVKAKHVYFYVACEMTNETVTDIGKMIRKDHATVIHGRNKIKNQLQFYGQLRSEITQIRYDVLTRNKLCPDHVDLLQLTINHTNSFLIKNN